jgi:hypothetical protein
MHWNCERCGFELFEIHKKTLLNIVETLDDDFSDLPENWQSINFDWIKICPRCHSDLLGLGTDHRFPIRSKSGDLTTIHDFDYVKAHKHSEYQKEILKSEICGCFYCCKTFSPDEIDQWHGEGSDEYEPLASCPKCSIDSVIGSASGFPIEYSFLKQMHDFWFEPKGGRSKLRISSED